MNAHKDTKHPAGQIRPTDAELKGQQSLSDYIRSINRAQAFDDVASELAEKVAEKKLTFDEWYSDYFGRDLADDVFSHRVMLISCWNAALLYGKVS